MNDNNGWAGPVWDRVEPIEYEDRQFNSRTAVTVILLAGIIGGFLVAMWHALRI